MKHVPDHTGRYEIVSLLGQKGMGVEAQAAHAGVIRRAELFHVVPVSAALERCRRRWCGCWKTASRVSALL